jgi:hydroxymethylpyrimidine pyrophosphatase-like HAD family hydrolase
MATLRPSDSLPLLCFASSIVFVLGARARSQRNISKQKHSFSIIALDLDGTTLNSSHLITDTTVKKLRSLSARGIKIVIGTGRSLGAVMDTLSTLQLGVEVNVVCLNGAMCVKVSKDTKTIENVFNDLVPSLSADKLLAFAARQGLVAQYYIGSIVYAAPKNEQHDALLAQYSTLTGKKQDIVPDNSGPIAIACAAKILRCKLE